MAMTRYGSDLRRLAAYVREPANWRDPLLAAIGGYSAALAAWSASHSAGLAAFLLRNELPLDARRALVGWLLAGAIAGLVLWAVLRLRAARRVPAGAAVGRDPRDLGRGAVPPAPDTVRDAGASPAPRGGRWPAMGLILTLILAAGYAAFMVALSLARHDAYLTNAFDMGIHDQALYNVLHSGYMRTTLYGPYAIDYIGDHFSPTLFLLVPFYALRQDATTLLVLQSLFLAAGAVPLFLLARLKTRSEGLALALVAAYLLHPALHGTNLDDFHQIALVVVFLLAAFYFLELGRDAPFLLALALALMVKEEVALTVVAIGAYAFLAKGRRTLGASLVVGGLIYFALVIGWVMPMLGGTPQIDKRFGGFMAEGTDGAAGVAWTLLSNPVYTVVHIFGNPDKVRYLLQMLLPLALVPFLAPASAWMVALPALAIVTLTTEPAQYDIAYHYSAHLLPALFYLAVLGLARLKRSPSARMAAVAPMLVVAILVAATGMSYLYGHLIPRAGAAWPQRDAHDLVVDGFVAQVPREASVSTLGGIAPHLTARKTIYLFPDVADAEYLLLDTDLGANYWPYEGLKARDQSIASMLSHVTSGEFGLVRSEDGVYLFRRGHDAAGNEAAVRGMLSTRYEAEEMRSDFDAPAAPDAGASGGLARLVTPAQRREDGKAALVYGPYTDLQPGNYRASYVMKAEGTPEHAVVATVDVFSHTDGYPRAVQEVRGGDWQTPGTWQSFSLDFNTSGQVLRDVELRVIYGGAGDLWLDRVELEYLGP